MHRIISAIFEHILSFLASPVKRRLFFIGILALVTLIDFLSLGLARRTFVFYTVSDGEVIVENRMLKRSKSKESDIIRYTEEALLGPVSPNLLPLFSEGTRLKALLYRDGTVYADLSIRAELPPEEGGTSYVNFRTLYEGIFRNFSYVKDVRFFIEGTAVYAGELGHREAIPPESFSEI